MEIVLYILLAILVLGIMPTMAISFIIYRALMLRTGKDVWSRSPSMPDDEEYVRLYDQAREWGEANEAYKKDLDIHNDGYHLFAEYFDFGSDKAVIILPGRMEACTYSYHYGEPYKAAGWNVLAIDNRAHGRSDGKVNSLGYKEYRDVLAWARLLQSEFGVRKVVLHGICIGASTALFAATAKDCPECVSGIVADGMYQCFYDSCKNHMVMDKRPIFPFLMETMLWIRIVSGANVVTDGPKKRIYRMTRPILFLHSREDPFSTPEKVTELYERCPSDSKRIEWFEHGGHSRLRITAPDHYDRTVGEFLATL